MMGNSRPCLMGLGPKLAKGWSADQVGRDVEGVVDGRVVG
jgi:hypothetical protein